MLRRCAMLCRVVVCAVHVYRAKWINITVEIGGGTAMEISAQQQQQYTVDNDNSQSKTITNYLKKKANKLKGTRN